MGTLGRAPISASRRDGERRSRFTPWANLVKWLVAVLFATSLSLPTAAADSAELETDIKAAMLYKFLGYIEWPEASFQSDDAPYVIAVIGAGAIADELRRITKDRTVSGRAIRVVEIDQYEELADTHLLFVGRRARANEQRLEKLAERYSVATVAENQRGLEKGCVINLRLVDGRVGFDVSLAAAQDRNLKLSARMLSVATTVEKEHR